MVEIFKDIPGYEGLYQASNLGRIKSLKYNKERILKPVINSRGYYEVCLRKNSKNKTVKVHRLVLLAFKGFSKLQCNHTDCDKLNNRIENLEYCTHLKNMQHARKNSLFRDEKKVDQYSIEGNYIRSFDSMMDAERALGIANSNISACCNGKRKTAGRFKWRFKEMKKIKQLSNIDTIYFNETGDDSNSGTWQKPKRTIANALRARKNIIYGGNMKREKVNSSNIVSVGYEKSILEVEFKSKKVYRYVEVPEVVYTDLVKADSVGSYFAKHIKGKFPFKLKDELDGIKEQIRYLLYAEFCLIEDFIKKVREEHEGGKQ